MIWRYNNDNLEDLDGHRFLPERLDEGHPFDVADGAAKLDDANFRLDLKAILKTTIKSGIGEKEENNPKVMDLNPLNDVLAH